MSSSQKIAIAAHLHALLRRKTGRVTDVEQENHPESGFIELTFGSFFGERAAHERNKQRNLYAPRYVRGYARACPS